MKLLTGRKIAEKMEKKLKKEFSKFSNKSLAIFQVGNDNRSNKYIEYKTKVAQRIGINITHKKFNINISEQKLKKEINKLIGNVNGAIVQLPLPKKMNTQKILNLIPINKDIDGLNKNNNIVVPATAMAIMQLINHYKIKIKNKKVGVVGQSNLIGKPVTNLLKKLYPKELMTFDKTTGISGTENMDILIVATGQKNLIGFNNVKKGAIVIDAGVNEIKEKNHTVGDVNFEEVKNKVKAITPAIGGIGPITIVSLLNNLLQLLKKQEL